jgi:hypothetical protein
MVLGPFPTRDIATKFSSLGISPPRGSQSSTENIIVGNEKTIVGNGGIHLGIVERMLAAADFSDCVVTVIDWIVPVRRIGNS